MSLFADPQVAEVAYMLFVVVPIGYWHPADLAQSRTKEGIIRLGKTATKKVKS
jgi:hypothetical protein